jgi:choline/ethanolamine kinase
MAFFLEEESNIMLILIPLQARSLTTAELSDARISAKIAEKMGQIHSLHIPVSKEADWIFNTINRWLNNVDTIMNDIRNNNNDDDQIPEIQKRLSKVDLRNEANWLKKVAETEAYPVVFCHNDLQEGNILFRQSNFVPFDIVETLDEELHKIDDLSPMLISCPKTKIEKCDNGKQQDTINGNSRKRSLVDTSVDCDEISSSTNEEEDSCKTNDPELMIIDFEYCAYNYRGFDIANHFLEWTYDYTNDKFPFFHCRPENYPNEQQMDNFITSYLQNTGTEDDEITCASVDEKKQLLEEIALFTVASHLFWAIWAVVNSNQEIEFGYWEYADIRLKEYFNAKDKYLKIKPNAEEESFDLETRRK